MSKNLSKILTILIAVIFVIGGALFINVMMQDESAEAISGAVSPLIEFSAFLFYAAVIITIVLSILSLVRNPQNLKATIIGVAGLAVLLIISYTLGDSNVVLDANGAILEGGEEGASINQWVGSLIWLSTMLVILGGILFVVDLLKSLIKS